MRVRGLSFVFTSVAHRLRLARYHSAIIRQARPHAFFIVTGPQFVTELLQSNVSSVTAERI